MIAIRKTVCLFGIVLAVCTRFSHASLIESGPWVGAVTPHSAVVKVVPKNGFRKIVLLLGEVGNPHQWQKILPKSAKGDSLEFYLERLKPDTSYQYLIEVNGNTENDKLGSFLTFPKNAATFQFAFASCAQTNSVSPVFTAIKNVKPLFYLNTGDLHYEDISKNDPDLFRKAYRNVLASPTQAELYRNIPLVYMWDDHDFAGDNSDGKSVARSAAREVYQEIVPHYPLVEGNGDVPIYQSFVIGRVKFLITDLRSERSPAAHADDAKKTMFGEKQKTWFKKELLNAKGKYALIFWVSSVPWITKSSKGGRSPPDHWGSYTTERREISDFIVQNQITGLCLLSGDSHMLAADDGTNSDYSTVGNLRIPVLQAGPLDRPKSQKGGPYSHGVYLPKPREGCFGLVKVEDNGADIRVSFSGRNQHNEEKIDLAFTVLSTPTKP